MNQNLQGKIALITGASKGIGEAIAWAMGNAGAKIILSSRKQDALDDLAKEFRSKGIETEGIAANNGNMEDLEKLINQIQSQFGQLDILVNNAGMNPVSAPIQDIEIRTYDKIMDVNLKGAFRLSQLAFPLLKASKGNVVNIASIEGITPSSHLGVYSMSKAAMIMMTKVMAKEWGKEGIRVNAICPGYIQTKLTESIWTNPDELQKILDQQVIPDLGKPEDIAHIALLLASEAGRFFTGSIITADAGFTL